MHMYTRAIVRTPGRSMVNGLTTAGLGKPDHGLALKQHGEYVRALESCGLKIVLLDPDEEFPDSTFIEDTALLAGDMAIITNPGAPSRRGETKAIGKILGKYFDDIQLVTDPGRVEAGDIMMVGSHFYIGLSGRTNEEGARQVIGFLARHGKTGSTVNLEKVLHLKTGVAYLENNKLLACGEFLSKDEFKMFNILEVAENESYAANCIWVNGTVLVPSGFPGVRRTIEAEGYKVMEVDVSEFRKLDGGLSCLSLRF